MSELICRKTMMRCQTPGMCAPHGGCKPQFEKPSALKETDVNYMDGFAQKVAAIGLPERKDRQDYQNISYQRSNMAAEWNACLDAAEPLVAGLRRRIANADLALKVQASNYEKAKAERDALRAEVERLQCDEQAFDGIVKMLDDLSTRNAELLGLLRDCQRLAMFTLPEALLKRIDAALAADEGRCDA